MHKTQIIKYIQLEHAGWVRSPRCYNPTAVVVRNVGLTVQLGMIKQNGSLYGILCDMVIICHFAHPSIIFGWSEWVVIIYSTGLIGLQTTVR